MNNPLAIISSDWHLRDSTPLQRKDDFFNAQMGKVEFVLKQAKYYKVPILHGGDMFHTWKSSCFLLQETIKLLKKYNVPIYVVAGNHDLPYHSIEKYSYSALSVLESAGVVTVLKQETPILLGNINLVGVPYSYKEDIKKLIVDGITNILITHQFVYTNPLPVDIGENAYTFLEKHCQFTLIVTGDNHQPIYIKSDDNRILINSGSLTRMNIDQKDYRPKIFLWGEENEVIPIDIPIDLDVFHERKERGGNGLEKIQEFIKKIEDSTTNLSFEKSLEKYLNDNKITEEIKKIIWGSLTFSSLKKHL